MGEKSCDFCKKDGILILPTRHTVAFNTSQKNIDQKDDPIEIEADYNSWLNDDSGGTRKWKTLRESPFQTIKTYQGISSPNNFGYLQKLLRAGYLYLYNGKKWQAYYVTKDGFYYPFDYRKPLPDSVKKDARPCNDVGHVLKAMTISVPQNSEKIWLKYSNVEWTEAVKKKYDSAVYRDKHMKSVNVKLWAKGGAHQSIRPLSYSIIANIIDFYNISQQPKGRKVKKSTYYTHNISSDLMKGRWIGESSKEELDFSESLAGQLVSNLGMVIPVDDPVGLTIDVNAYLREYNNLQKDKIPKPEKVAGIIRALAPAIKQASDDDNIAAGIEMKDRIETGQHPLGPAFDIGPMGNPVYIPDSMKKHFENVDKPSAANLDKWGRQEWAKYEKYIDAQKYNAAINAAGQREINRKNNPPPLEKWYLEVIKSSVFKNVFASEFDENNIKHGIAYTEIVALCIADTHENYACADHYIKMLSGEVNDENFLLNALALNQKQVKDKLSSINKSNWAGVPWDSIISTFEKALEQHALPAYQSLSVLTGNLAGPVYTLAIRATDIANRALVMCGVMGRQRINFISITSTAEEFFDTLSRSIIQVVQQNDGFLNNVPKLRARLRAINIRAETVSRSGQVSSSFLITTPDMVAARRYNRLGDIVRVSQIKATSITAGGQAGVMALIGSVLQYAAFTKASDELSKLAQNDIEFAEQISRLMVGGVGIGMVIGEGVQGGLRAWANQAAQRAGASVIREGGLMSRFIASRFFLRGAVVLALFTGGWDIYNGLRLGFSGKAGEGGALVVSGLAGIGAAIAFFFLMPVLGWILAAVCIISALIVMFITDNALQKWINKSCLGKNQGEKSYGSTGIDELAEFQKLFA